MKSFSATPRRFPNFQEMLWVLVAPNIGLMEVERLLGRRPRWRTEGISDWGSKALFTYDVGIRSPARNWTQAALVGGRRAANQPPKLSLIIKLVLGQNLWHLTPPNQRITWVLYSAWLTFSWGFSITSLDSSAIWSFFFVSFCCRLANSSTVDRLGGGSAGPGSSAAAAWLTSLWSSSSAWSILSNTMKLRKHWSPYRLLTFSIY